MAQDFQMQGKVAVITGAGNPFGKALAMAFAKHGAGLFLQEYPGNEERLEKLRDAAREFSPRVETGVYDMTVQQEAVRMATDAQKLFGHLDVLVNAGAGGGHGKLFEFTEEEWDRAIDRGLKAHFLACQQVGKVMARQGKGKIINITSITADLGAAGSVPWCAAKGGANAMTFALAQALGLYGVHVVALCRGASDHTGYEPEEVKERMRRLPFGRIGTAEDIVGPALFLASDHSNWVTGSVLYADGGYTTAAVTDDKFRPGRVPYDGV